MTTRGNSPSAAAIALLAVALATAAVAAEAPATTAAELTAAHARRFEAMVSRDLEALDGLLAEELTYTHSSGKVESKAEFLAALEGGGLRYLAIESEDEALRLYGDGSVGVITGTGRFRVRLGEREGEITLRYTSVYVHRDNRWRLTAWHSSAVPAEGDG